MKKNYECRRLTAERTVVNQNGTLYVSIPKAFADRHRIQAGDRLANTGRQPVEDHPPRKMTTDLSQPRLSPHYNRTRYYAKNREKFTYSAKICANMHSARQFGENIGNFLKL